MLKQGRLEECLAEVEKRVRSAPADAKQRVMLFQVLALLGQWDRAINQLEVCAELDSENQLMAQVYRAVILCEKFREEVFKGERTPLILGEPEPWLGMLVQSVMHAGKGDHEAAAQLREQAFEAAPTTAGTLGVGFDEDAVKEHAFEWIADWDGVLGPVLEAFVDGKYYWVPWNRIGLLRIETPADLRDTVWMPGQIMLTAGGEKVTLIPARYPGSQDKSRDPLVRVARKSEFISEGGRERAVGQRMFNTDAGEFGLMDVRMVRAAGFKEPEPEATPGTDAGAEPARAN